MQAASEAPRRCRFDESAAKRRKRRVVQSLATSCSRGPEPTSSRLASPASGSRQSISIQNLAASSKLACTQGLPDEAAVVDKLKPGAKRMLAGRALLHFEFLLPCASSGPFERPTGHPTFRRSPPLPQSRKARPLCSSGCRLAARASSISCSALVFQAWYLHSWTRQACCHRTPTWGAPVVFSRSKPVLQECLLSESMLLVDAKVAVQACLHCSSPVGCRRWLWTGTCWGPLRARALKM